MLAVKLALDRAPRYQAEIKEWVHAQTGYHIAFARVSPSFRWYGPELYFERLELRSKDDRRVLARAAGGRVAADIWQLISSGKLLAGTNRARFAEYSRSRAWARPALRWLPRSNWAATTASLETLTLDDLPAGKLAIRHATVTMENWNSALPRLTLQDVNLDVRRGEGGLTLVLNSRLPPALGGSLKHRRQCARPRRLANLELGPRSGGRATFPCPDGASCCRSI